MFCESKLTLKIPVTVKPISAWRTSGTARCYDMNHRISLVSFQSVFASSHSFLLQSPAISQGRSGRYDNVIPHGAQPRLLKRERRKYFSIRAIRRKSVGRCCDAVISIRDSTCQAPSTYFSSELQTGSYRRHMKQ